MFLFHFINIFYYFPYLILYFTVIYQNYLIECLAH